jgi:hypothetical protein
MYVIHNIQEEHRLHPKVPPASRENGRELSKDKDTELQASHPQKYAGIETRGGEIITSPRFGEV